MGASFSIRCHKRKSKLYSETSKRIKKKKRKCKNDTNVQQLRSKSLNKDAILLQ